MPLLRFYYYCYHASHCHQFTVTTIPYFNTSQPIPSHQRTILLVTTNATVIYFNNHHATPPPLRTIITNTVIGALRTNNTCASPPPLTTIPSPSSNWSSSYRLLSSASLIAHHAIITTTSTYHHLPARRLCTRHWRTRHQSTHYQTLTWDAIIIHSINNIDAHYARKRNIHYLLIIAHLSAIDALIIDTMTTDTWRATLSTWHERHYDYLFDITCCEWPLVCRLH